MNYELSIENDGILSDFYNEHNGVYNFIQIIPSRYVTHLTAVLEKIEQSEYVDETIISYSEGQKLEHLCEIRPSQKNTFTNSISMAKTKHEAIYTACLKFVEWYNLTIKQ